MDIKKAVHIAPGRYVVAVSGGVDSMVLLDILAKMSKVESLKSKEDLPSFRHADFQTFNSKPYGFVVAHFDHGIRPDSRDDRRLVEHTAKQYKLPFVYAEGNLGQDASEDAARKARYAFLRRVQKDLNLDGIITAHHHDDVLETATHNLLRGTGRKGMTSLKSVDGIIRPLLPIPKQRLLAHAYANNITWREDSTNQNTTYRRNYIRHNVLPLLRERSPEKYDLLKQLIRRQTELNQAIDTALLTILHTQPSVTTLKRNDVVRLPHAVQRELVGEWLRNNGYRDFGRKHVERTTVAVKTARPCTVLVLNKNAQIEFDKHHARFVIQG